MRHSPGHKSFTIFKNDFSLLASIEYFKLSLNKINPFSIFLFPACSKIYSFWKLKYQWNRSHDVDCSIWHRDQCQNECHSLNQLLIGIKSYVLFCFFPFEVICRFFHIWLTFGKPQEMFIGSGLPQVENTCDTEFYGLEHLYLLIK